MPFGIVLEGVFAIHETLIVLLEDALDESVYE
jgi:hypothetical protein